MSKTIEKILSDEKSRSAASIESSMSKDNSSAVPWWS